MAPFTKTDASSTVSTCSGPRKAPDAPANLTSPIPRPLTRASGNSSAKPRAAPSSALFVPAQPHAAVFAETPIRSPGTVSQFGIRRLRQSVYAATSAIATANSSGRALKSTPAYNRIADFSTPRANVVSIVPTPNNCRPRPIPKSTKTAITEGHSSPKANLQKQRPGVGPGLWQNHSDSTG